MEETYFLKSTQFLSFFVRATYFVTVLKLQDTPLEDQFLKNITNQSTYPLELALCNECGYVFLPHRINPEASYSDYIYVSGVTVGLRNHYDSMHDRLFLITKFLVVHWQ